MLIVQLQMYTYKLLWMSVVMLNATMLLLHLLLQSLVIKVSSDVT
jgi:hypothetical protein